MQVKQAKVSISGSWGGGLSAYEKSRREGCVYIPLKKQGTIPLGDYAIEDAQRVHIRKEAEECISCSAVDADTERGKIRLHLHTSVDRKM